MSCGAIWFTAVIQQWMNNFSMQFRHFHFLGCEAAALTRAFFPPPYYATRTCSHKLGFFFFSFLSKLLSLLEILVEGPIRSIIFLAKKWFLKDYPWPDRVLVIKSDKKTLGAQGLTLALGWPLRLTYEWPRICLAWLPFSWPRFSYCS